VTFEPERYPFVERDSGPGPPDLAPLLPITLTGTTSALTWGLLDTGAAVNVLPYRIGIELGASWEQQTFLIPLSGNLAAFEARGLVLSARIGNFPDVQLAFAWAMTDAVPILLGQMNFFLEFDVCFHRSRLFFEVQPKHTSLVTNPD
jgi:hypothetical protein